MTKELILQDLKTKLDTRIGEYILNRITQKSFTCSKQQLLDIIQNVKEDWEYGDLSDSLSKYIVNKIPDYVWDSEGIDEEIEHCQTQLGHLNDGTAYELINKITDSEFYLQHFFSASN